MQRPPVHFPSAGEKPGDLPQRQIFTEKPYGSGSTCLKCEAGQRNPGSDSINHANRAEKEHNRSDQDSTVDAGELKPQGGSLADVVTGGNGRLRCTKAYKIGTWNVRGMSLGKLDIIKKEIKEQT